MVNKKDPIILHDNAQPHVVQPMLQKLNKLGYEVLPHLPYSPDLSPADYLFFRHLDNFIQDKLFHRQQDAENAFPIVGWIPKHKFLHYRNRQTYFSLAKVLIVMVPILINKDMFEPSYNDLKFMVWTHNCVCTNPIKIDLPDGPAIPLLGVYPENNMVQKDTYNSVFIGGLVYNSQDMEVT